MRTKHYIELIHGSASPLSRKEAIFQAIYLIQKECYESALLIINNYNIQKGELSFFNLKDKDLSDFTKYLNNKSIK